VRGSTGNDKREERDRKRCVVVKEGGQRSKREERGRDKRNNIREPVSRCGWARANRWPRLSRTVTRDWIKFVTEHGPSTASASTNQPPHKFPLGRQLDNPLIPGNHGRLFKIQLPPISAKCHTPHVFRRRAFFYPSDRLTCFVNKSPSLLFIATTTPISHSLSPSSCHH
jgi:hypothetical protein